MPPKAMLVVLYTVIFAVLYAWYWGMSGLLADGQLVAATVLAYGLPVFVSIAAYAKSVATPAPTEGVTT
jgi:hypothetical protein